MIKAVKVKLYPTKQQEILMFKSCGVDLGIKSLAVVSNIEKPFKNINKSKEIKEITKKTFNEI